MPLDAVAPPNSAKVFRRPTVLVVEPDTSDAIFFAGTLSGAGFHVTIADSFTAAKERLLVQNPAVLVTALRLGEYNGLHLVMRGKSLHRSMAAIVLSDVLDTVLAEEAERLGATHIVKPITKPEMLAAVFRTLFRRDGDGAPLRPPFERRVNERRAFAEPASSMDRRRIERRRGVSGPLWPGSLN